MTCELNHEQGCAHWHFEKCDCDCHALHQAELNWLTEQIEMGEFLGKEHVELYNGKLPFVIFGGKADEQEKIAIYRQALSGFLHPLIERKKEVEKLLGREEGV